MELPAITLPKIDLPFDIDVLLHPAVAHFAIALPVVILLLEFYNLFARKKSIGGFSFILIILTIVLFAAAYFTGGVDGKETFDLLSSEGQAELKEHKLLGTYLLLGSALLFVLKLLAMTGMKLFKLLFFVGLIGLVVGTLNQGKEGGELTYEHGANVAKVKALNATLFDIKDDLSDVLEEAKAKAQQAVAEPIVEKPAVEETLPKEEVTQVVTSAVEPAVTEAKVIETPPAVATNPVASESTNAEAQKVLDTASQEVKNAGEKALSQINR